MTGALAASALMMSATGAGAGGFEVREQSAYFQGMSFAGSAAGGSLSSMFWNPAAAGLVGTGITMESHLTLILPDSEITVDSITFPGGAIPLAGADRDAEIGRDAVVPASYAAWRYNAHTVFALSINSQFGLGTEPDNPNWAGQVHSQTAKLFSVNAAPTVAYEVAPGVTIAGGVQFQYLDLKHLKSAVPVPANRPPPFPNSSVLEGDDVSVGFTAGLMWKPVPGTTIGVGFRSSIEHDLEGTVAVTGTPLLSPIHADLELPEKVTLGLRQDLAPNLRATGTVEWTNWSRLGVIPIILDAPFGTAPTGAPVAKLDFQWHDGWFFALGAEYDLSPKVTLRTGVAYEISPIQNASERLLQLPDADRWWASLGGTYKWSDTMSFDFAYTHIFVEDADVDRFPSSTNPSLAVLRLMGTAESSVDIISASIKTRW
jgi:long-chain fatty acid transport protein